MKILDVSPNNERLTMLVTVQKNLKEVGDRSVLKPFSRLIQEAYDDDDLLQESFNEFCDTILNLSMNKKKERQRELQLMNDPVSEISENVSAAVNIAVKDIRPETLDEMFQRTRKESQERIAIQDEIHKERVNKWREDLAASKKRVTSDVAA